MLDIRIKQDRCIMGIKTVYLALNVVFFIGAFTVVSKTAKFVRKV